MSNLNETVTATERLYEGKVVNLRIDTVTLPNGKSAKREVVEHSGAIAAVPLTDDGRIIFVRQNRLPAGGVLLEVPAGSLNEGEIPDLCVARELQEEIGYVPGNIEKLFSMFVAPGYSSELIHVYVASKLTPSKIPGDEDEFIEVVTLTVDEALARIDSGEIRDAKSIAGILAVDRRRRA
jgi:ADP-ribose pyrophosphatase